MTVDQSGIARGRRYFVRPRTVFVCAAVAVVVAVALVVADGDRRASTVRAATSDSLPEANDLSPLRLAPGAYRYASQELSPEITNAGVVIHAARLEDRRTLELVVSQRNGDWVERNTDTGRSIVRSYHGGFHQTEVDGEAPEPSKRNAAQLENDELARSRGSSLPAGGPRIEFNPYGASFLVYLEKGQNDEATASGLVASSTSEAVDCGDTQCVRTTFSREIVRPPDSAEYYRSLPWADSNVEESVIVYEPETQLVRQYESSFNGTVLHAFELLERP